MATRGLGLQAEGGLEQSVEEGGLGLPVERGLGLPAEGGLELFK